MRVLKEEGEEERGRRGEEGISSEQASLCSQLVSEILDRQRIGGHGENNLTVTSNLIPIWLINKTSIQS